MRVLTFRVGGYHFAVPAESVSRILPSNRSLPEGTGVVDAVGLIREGGDAAERNCIVVLGADEFLERPVAITASRAGEVRALPAERLLPIQGFLFRGENPFRGLIAPEHEDEEPVFLLAGPERLLASAGAR